MLCRSLPKGQLLETLLWCCARAVSTLHDPLLRPGCSAKWTVLSVAFALCPKLPCYPSYGRPKGHGSVTCYSLLSHLVLIRKPFAGKLVDCLPPFQRILSSASTRECT